MFRLMLTLLIAGAAAAQQPPVRILISYHSESGNTAKLAEAIRKGATLPGVAVTLKSASDVSDDEVTRYDGIVFGAPVHWQTASADGKRFLDRVAAAFQK